MNLLSDPRWNDAIGHLPDYLGNHVRVSVAALVLGLAASFPLALMSRNRPVMRSVLLDEPRRRPRRTTRTSPTASEHASHQGR